MEELHEGPHLEGSKRNSIPINLEEDVDGRQNWARSITPILSGTGQDIFEDERDNEAIPVIIAEEVGDCVDGVGENPPRQTNGDAGIIIQGRAK
jgi:hypothetical protein